MEGHHVASPEAATWPQVGLEWRFKILFGLDRIRTPTAWILSHQLYRWATRLVRVMVAGGVVVIECGSLGEARKGASPPSHGTTQRNHGPSYLARN